MDDLKSWYRGGLITPINALRIAQRELSHNSDAVESIRRIAHTLRGSGGTYGFPEISDAALHLEEAPHAEVPASLIRLLRTLEEIASRPDMEDKSGILVIDDDSYISALLLKLLESSNREIFQAGSARQAEQILEEKKISLIILDLMLPDTDGRNFLVRLKERPITASIPVIVLSAKLGSQTKTECFALGADAYFEKPFEIDTLSAAVSAQLHRSEVNLREARVDHLTGLPNRAAFREAFIRQSSLAGRKQEPLTVAIMDLDRFKQVNDNHGHAVGDEVLRQSALIVRESLRRSDLLARWGGEEFVALFPETNLEGAAAAVRKAAAVLREHEFSGAGGQPFRVTLSAGLALVEEKHTVGEAIAEADRFLYNAKSQGRNRVLSSLDPIEEPSRELLVAEADETVAGIMKSRLGREGFRITHCSDGDSLLEAARQGSFSLCIFSSNLQDGRGVEWLERLRQIPNCSGMPILLLTALGHDKDIAKGFQFGADDYLVKPFSPLELVARVRNLLRKS